MCIHMHNDHIKEPAVHVRVENAKITQQSPHRPNEHIYIYIYICGFKLHCKLPHVHGCV